MGDFSNINYGTKGIGTPTTMPGGREEGNTCWVDSAGNLWLFGGSMLNDMWRYEVNTGIWTWMSGTDMGNDGGNYGTLGVPSVNNYPSGRNSICCWKANSGKFFLSGGSDWSANENWYQDTWQFNPATLEWTWMAGPSGNDTSHPVAEICDTVEKEGARYENRALWKYADNVILNYGGFFGTPSNTSNELWAFIPSTGKWIKIDEAGTTGHYGTKGIASPLNYPPARIGSCAFMDREKNLWLFSGYGAANDLWKYVVDTTCMAGFINEVNCPAFSATIEADKVQICASDSALICPTQNFSSYIWNNGSTARCITTKLAGNYYVTVTDNNGCQGTSNHLAIAVYNLPPVSISVNGDTLNAFNATTYQWFLNGSPIASATTSQYIIKVAGTYTVMVTDTNGCTATSNPILFTGIDKLENSEVTVYPNPNNMGIWQLQLTENLLGGQLEMIDAAGRVVLNAWVDDLKMQISPDVASGVYIIHITTFKKTVSLKLIKL